MKRVEDYVRSIPDFPEPGIIFRDITSVLQDADGLQLAIDSMQACLKNTEVDVIAGTESRGFIFGVPIAYNLHKPFVPVRKKGKLPCETVSRSYDLEYGSATIEMHKDSIKPGPDRNRRYHRSCDQTGRGTWRRSSQGRFPYGTCRTERQRKTCRL